MCESSDSSDSEESEDSESNEEVPDRVNTNQQGLKRSLASCSVGPRRSIVHPLPSQLHEFLSVMKQRLASVLSRVEGRICLSLHRRMHRDVLLKLDVSNTEEALKCWNLERIIDAESMGVAAPAALTLNDLLNEEEHEEDDNVDKE